jgi:hypothetical protein
LLPVEYRGAHQDSEWKHAGDGHSQTVECRESDLSGQREKASEKGYSLPVEHGGGAHQDSKIKPETRGAYVLSGTRQDSEKYQRAMSIYQLSNAEGRPVRTAGIKPASQEHSLAVERRGRK